MFTHVIVGADDIEASRRFYDAALGALDVEPGAQDPKGRYWWRTRRGAFAVGKPIDAGSLPKSSEDGIAQLRRAVLDLPPPGPGAAHMSHLREARQRRRAHLRRIPEKS